MITQEELKERLYYNPDTGIFTWLNNKRSTLIGCIAGCISNGYIVIKINYHLYRAHRLAFLYMTGSIPKFIDHEDTNKSNNKWNNIREATKAQNNSNVYLRKDNTSGYKGVSLNKHVKSESWLAQIFVNNEQIYVGSFKTPEEAAHAYDEAAIEYHKEFANLNV